MDISIYFFYFYSDPNIVLSKLRGIQMPIEHKQIDNDNEEELCRDRSICQSILNAAESNEKLIHKALGNFAIRQLIYYLFIFISFIKLSTFFFFLFMTS